MKTIKVLVAVVASLMTMQECVVAQNNVGMAPVQLESTPENRVVFMGIDAPDATGLLRQANAKFDAQDFTGAYADASMAVKTSPSNYGAYAFRALCARALSVVCDTSKKTLWIDTAIQSIQVCINNKFNLEFSYGMLANCYEELENYEKAVECYGKVLNENSKNIKALHSMGKCKAELKDYSGSLVEYMKAIKYEGLIDYDYASVFVDIAISYGCMDNTTQADKYIKEALKRDKRNGLIWYLDAGSALEMKDFHRCIVSASNAIALLGNQLDFPYYYRGLAKAKQSDYNGAYLDLEKLKSIGSEWKDSLATVIDMGKVNFESITSSERIITNPKCENTSNGLFVKAIEATANYTALHLVKATSESFNISPDTYIIDKKTKEKLYLLKAENCAFPPQRSFPRNGKVEFVLYFPIIDPACKKIDFYENEDSKESGTYAIGIELKSATKPGMIKIAPEDVVVTFAESVSVGMEYVESGEEQEFWNNVIRTEAGAIENCKKAFQKKAAKMGCTVVVIKNTSNREYIVQLKGKFYRPAM